MPMLSESGPPVVDTPAPSEQEVTGEPGFVAGGPAAPGADEVARAAYPEDWAALDSNLEATVADRPEGTSQIYTNYIVNPVSTLQTMYPHKQIGRFTFTTSEGDKFCSGTSIYGNVMLTAAHCVYDTVNNVWYTNMAFTPAYRNGSVLYGTFPTTSSDCHVLPAWVNLTGDYDIETWARYDMAVCEMDRNSSGSTLSSAVGWMGFGWNFDYVRHLHALGYPSQNYNDEYLTNAGKYLRTCAAETFEQATDTRGIGCYYSHGMSGGPWMAEYAINVNQGYVLGVSSGHYRGTQNAYGAAFTSSNIVVLCSAAGC
jgi:V8-like Glu-specific endopeptidase